MSKQNGDLQDRLCNLENELSEKTSCWDKLNTQDNKSYQDVLDVRDNEIQQLCHENMELKNEVDELFD